MSKPPESFPISGDHIEGSRGVWLPARLVFAEHLEFQQAGFNFWQQPPFNLIEAFFTSSDFEPFSDECEASELSRLLILMATSHLVTPAVLDEARILAITNIRRREGIYNRLADQYLQHFGSILKPEVATALASKEKGDQEKRKVALVQIAQIVEKVRAYLAQYPFCFRYVDEMVGESRKNFFPDGSVNVDQNPPASQAKISSYVGYSGKLGTLSRTDASRLAGLADELPQDGEQR